MLDTLIVDIFTCHSGKTTGVTNDRNVSDGFVTFRLPVSHVSKPACPLTEERKQEVIQNIYKHNTKNYSTMPYKHIKCIDCADFSSLFEQMLKVMCKCVMC